jgi:hypothetical protein
VNINKVRDYSGFERIIYGMKKWKR